MISQGSLLKTHKDSVLKNDKQLTESNYYKSKSTISEEDKEILDRLKSGFDELINKYTLQ